VVVSRLREGNRSSKLPSEMKRKIEEPSSRWGRGELLAIRQVLSEGEAVDIRLVLLLGCMP